MATRVIQCT